MWEPETTAELTETTRRLGEAPVGRLLLRLSLPGIAAMITMSLYNIVDTFWVAKLGYQAIAALTVALPYQILIFAISFGSGIGANALASRRFGEGNTEATDQVAGQVLVLSGVLGVVFLMAAVFFAEPILIVSGATPDIMDMAVQYLRIIGLGAPFICFLMIADNLFRASGDAVKPMIFVIVAAVTNIILDPFLIFGYGPFPELGVRGAALASVIGQLIGAGIGFYYIVARRSAYRIRLPHLRPRLRVLRDIYRVGFPSITMHVAETVLFALFNFVLSGFGSLALAAVGLTIRLADLAFMPIFGVAEGLLPIIGFNFGARSWRRVWGAVKLASVAIALTMAVVTVAFEIFTPQIVAIFSNDAELVAIAVPAMRIFLSTLVLVGPAIMFTTTFQGLSKGKEAMFLSLARQFIFTVPLLFILSRTLGLSGVWLSMPIGDTLAFVVSGLWLLREYRRQQRQGLWSAEPVTEGGNKWSRPTG